MQSSDGSLEEYTKGSNRRRREREEELTCRIQWRAEERKVKGGPVTDHQRRPGLSRAVGASPTVAQALPEANLYITTLFTCMKNEYPIGNDRGFLRLSIEYKDHLFAPMRLSRSSKSWTLQRSRMATPCVHQNGYHNCK